MKLLIIIFIVKINQNFHFWYNSNIYSLNRHINKIIWWYFDESVDDLFQDWENKFKIHFNKYDYFYRKKIFGKNVKKIIRHN